jgi:hypothetical protein
MTKYFDEILTEVRRNKAALLEEHGGLEGYLKYLDEKRPQWERVGWVFADLDKVIKANSVEEPLNT